MSIRDSVGYEFSSRRMLNDVAAESSAFCNNSKNTGFPSGYRSRIVLRRPVKDSAWP